MKAAFGKVWKLEAQGGSIIGALPLLPLLCERCADGPIYRRLHQGYSRTLRQPAAAA